MASVGEKLRRARLDKGLDLAEVSARTKISLKFLEAIEADDRQSLPAGFFYRNWVRQYAGALSLDVNAFAAEVDRVISDDEPLPLPGQQHRLPQELRVAPMAVAGQGGGRRMLSSVALLIAVIIGCSALYAWWRSAQVSVVAARQENSSVTPTPSTYTPPQEPATPTPVPSPTPGDPQATPVVPVPSPSPSDATGAAPGEPTTPAVTPSPGDLNIEVAATEATWLSISPDGKQGFSGVLQPAEVKTVAAHERARIKIGNAGGLLVRLNGKPIGPIGPEGQVRTVLISKEGVKILDPRASAAVSPAAFRSDGGAAIPPPLNQ